MNYKHHTFAFKILLLHTCTYSQIIVTYNAISEINLSILAKSWKTILSLTVQQKQHTH